MKGVNEAPAIPDYVLTRRCGRGGCSEVWLGSDRHGRLRAVRTVSKNLAPALLELERRSLLLYRTQAGDHTHLLPVLAAGETPEYL